MMKALRLLTLLALLPMLFLMQGCGVFGPVQPTPGAAAATALPEAGKQAQLAINEANVTIAAAAAVIRGNITDQIWTKAQAQGYLDKVKSYRKDVDRAQEALDAGSFVTAQGQANAVRSLIVILHREVAAQARKEGAK